MPIGRPSNDRQLNPRLDPRGQRGGSVCIMYTKTRRIWRESGQRASNGSPRQRKREKTRPGKEERERKRRRRRSRQPNEYNIVAIRRTCRKFCSLQQLLRAVAPPFLRPFFVTASSTLANNSLTRLWNKLAVLGLFQRAMGKRERAGKG